MSTQPSEHIWWLASRASGIVALMLISASVLVGLAMASRLFRRPGLPRVLGALHEQLSVAGLVAVGVHGVTLLGDSYLHPGLSGIAIPFAIGYRPAFVAAGIVGGYLAAILGLSYYARRRIGSRRWRNAHRYIVVAWLLAVVHTLGAGTDAALPVVRWAVLAPLVPAALLFAARFLPRRTAPEQAAPPGSGEAAPRSDDRLRLTPSAGSVLGGPLRPAGRLGPLGGVELGLAQAHAVGSDLDALVLAQELDRLLEREQLRRDQADQDVGAGGADVGLLLLLGRVDVEVVGAGVLADRPCPRRPPRRAR